MGPYVKRKYRDQDTTKNYRLSIQSFPDYKHLLQENYLDMLELS